MTDLEKVTQLFNELGIEHEIGGYKDTITIVLKAKEHAKVTGYAGFACDFTFTPDGKFANVGIYE